MSIRIFALFGYELIIELETSSWYNEKKWCEAWITFRIVRDTQQSKVHKESLEDK